MKNIRESIEEKGSITVAEFMEMAMYDNNQGYYINESPIGRDGDFITAPEVSQLFGEMVGVYCVDTWIKMGKPSQFNLVELGPGRATLMLDCLRATKHIKGFHEAFKIHLVDTNQRLIAIQKQALKEYDVTWHKDVFTLPKNLPLIIIANEFFDCLPINQYVQDYGIWKQQSVAIMPRSEEFHLIKTPILAHFSESLSREYPNSKHGSVVEICYPAITIVQHLAAILTEVPGVCLVIDYGYDVDPLIRKNYNSTLQAVKNHKYHPIFSDIGRADLTAHVDFFALKQTALTNFCKVDGSITQREFLQKMGIEFRAKNLCESANAAQRQEIISGLARLTNPKQMGDLFRALEISTPNLLLLLD